MRFKRVKRGCRRSVPFATINEVRAERRIAKRRASNGRVLFAKINVIRVDRGLPMLESSTTLALGARHHSQSMKKARKLFHDSGTFYENCYKGPMSRCVPSWMRSRGHRENLLQPTIHRGAVGVVGNYATFRGAS